MFVFANKETGEFLGTSGLVTAQGKSGEELSIIDEREALKAAAKNYGLPKNKILATRVTDLDKAIAISQQPKEGLAVSIANGVLAVEIDPDYTPPPPPPATMDVVRQLQGVVEQLQKAVAELVALKDKK